MSLKQPEPLAALVRSAVAAAIAEEGWEQDNLSYIEVFDDGSWIYDRNRRPRQSGRWDRDPDGVHGIYVRVDV